MIVESCFLHWGQGNHRLRRVVPVMSPRVSIILPTHNGARYLLDSIQSCLCQSFSDFELIIVDDCSTDNTPQLLREVSDPRLKVIRLSKNLKLPGALNAGMEVARGDFHTWTSDDNRYLPGALERMVEYLELHPEVDGVYTDTYRLLDEARIGRWHSGPSFYLSQMQIVGACFLYRKEVWDRVGRYDDTTFLVEDYDWWVRAWRSGARLHHIPEVWYEYRVHQASLGESHGRSKVDEKRRLVRDRHFRKWELVLWRAFHRIRRLALYLFARDQYLRERWVGQTEPGQSHETGKVSQSA